MYFLPLYFTCLPVILKSYPSHFKIPTPEIYVCFSPVAHNILQAINVKSFFSSSVLIHSCDSNGFLHIIEMPSAESLTAPYTIFYVSFSFVPILLLSNRICISSSMFISLITEKRTSYFYVKIKSLIPS